MKPCLEPLISLFSSAVKNSDLTDNSSLCKLYIYIICCRDIYLIKACILNNSFSWIDLNKNYIIFSIDKRFCYIYWLFGVVYQNSSGYFIRLFWHLKTTYKLEHFLWFQSFLVLMSVNETSPILYDVFNVLNECVLQFGVDIQAICQLKFLPMDFIIHLF